MRATFASLNAAVARALSTASASLPRCAATALAALAAAVFSPATRADSPATMFDTVSLVSSDTMATAPTCRYCELVNRKKRISGTKSVSVRAGPARHPSRAC
jgi:spore coat protein U-like protein